MILRKLFPAFQKEASKSDVYISPRYTRRWVGCSYFGDLKVNMPDYVTGSRFSVFFLVSIESCGDKLQVIQGIVNGVEALSDGTAIRSVSKSTTTIPCVLFVDCAGSSSIGKKLLPTASDKWGPNNRTSRTTQKLAIMARLLNCHMNRKRKCQDYCPNIISSLDDGMTVLSLEPLLQRLRPEETVSGTRESMGITVRIERWHTNFLLYSIISFQCSFNILDQGSRHLSCDRGPVCRPMSSIGWQSHSRKVPLLG
ncbi:uncharacterized protein EI90DRAFT_2509323 [Cantharellus anzutake]|uniref:uncharacterized protein n=1 Tax=Cantharellus anzutake TaxID=1750568 RepID=UPI001907CD2E|nr:uncharacterized protein EI90DRAFT_2509323 [Cantharellus anzutake]KAF8321407.1 hypothetical protein EI90DRAFT_2509323 [Cantharellus anzutake]